MKNSSPLVLIGGFGFVGRNILQVLSDHEEFAGLSPAVIDNLSTAAPGHEALDVPVFQGGYQDEGAGWFLDELSEGTPGRIFAFLAGETRVAESNHRPLDFIEANITEPARFVLRNLREGDHFLLISTAGALFDGSFEVRTDSPYCPKNFYGATKAAEEMILERLVERQGASYSVIRMTNVYGPFSERKVSAVHAFTRAALEGAEITINGDGQQSRDFIYAGDVGRAIATQALRVREGQDYDRVNMIGSGVSTSLMDVVAAVENVSDQSLTQRKVPATDLLKTEPRDVIANRDDVSTLLGDSHTPFAEGIRLTYSYYAAKAAAHKSAVA